MAQTILLSSPSLPSFNPPSPDPTPLRMLAFSVAEAALQPDPNSPMFREYGRVPEQDEIQEWNDQPLKSRLSRWVAEPKETIATRRGKPLWDMVERAKERRERERCRFLALLRWSLPTDQIASPSTIDSPLPTSPPISPDSYNFVLPSNSYLAADVAKGLTSSPTKQYPYPLFTRSAEPSPTKSTFSTLDQTQPPPEFKPRLSAKEYAATVGNLPSPSQRLKAQAISRINWPSPSRHTAKAKLPSLAEIQRKVNTGAGLRRSDSTSSSEDDIRTPEEEIKSLNLVTIRSSTPPAESRLAPFLRQRTSGRLVAGTRPVTMPPISIDQDPSNVYGEKPTFTVTPPSATPSVPPPSARRQVFTPTRPSRVTSSASPTSPTDSIGRSPSPTLSIPIITCTPAQQSDSESDTDSEVDVVVFDGEMEEAREKEERSKRGKAMRDRLLQARRSSVH